MNIEYEGRLKVFQTAFASDFKCNTWEMEDSLRLTVLPYSEMQEKVTRIAF